MLDKVKTYLVASAIGVIGILPFKVLAYVLLIASVSFLFTMVSFFKKRRKIPVTQYILFLSKLLLYAVVIPALYVLSVELGVLEIWGFFISVIFVHEFFELLNQAEQIGLIPHSLVEKIRNFIQSIWGHDRNS